MLHQLFDSPRTHTVQMAEAQKYYFKHTSTPEPQSDPPSKRSALRTYASSPDMSLPLVQQPVQLSRAIAHAYHNHHQHLQWRSDDSQPPHLPAAQPDAASICSTDPPSMVESSAAPEPVAPPRSQEAPANLKPPQIPLSLPLMHGPTRSCLKHAGVGKMSPPQAREQPKAAAGHLAVTPVTPVAYVQASSIQADPQGVYSSLESGSAGLPPVFESAFSGASQVPAEEQLPTQLPAQLSGSSECRVTEPAGGRTVAEQWPETCSWTMPCHVFKYRTVTFSFKDPSLPVMLRPAINVSPLSYPNDISSCIKLQR